MEFYTTQKHGMESQKKHVEDLSIVDKNLMRFILSAHAKTPTEFLYLESGVKPVNFVISSRRLNYMKEIHMRDDHELIKRVLQAQIKNPVKGDWTELVKIDMNECEINEEHFNTLSKVEAKNEIKKKVNEAAFRYLKREQAEHSKVRHIVYPNYEIQNYLKSARITNKEAEIITALRSKTLRGFKDNFHTYYRNNLTCDLCELHTDTQEHCMNCPKILEKLGAIDDHIKYEHIFGTTEEQKKVAQLFTQVLNCREELLLE